MFDYDGVLVDTFDYFCDAFTEACHEHGFTQFDGAGAFLALFEQNMYDGMAAAGVPREVIDDILRTMAAKIAARNGAYSFFAGVRDTLEWLSAQAELFIVTSNVGAPIQRFLQRQGIDFFRGVLGAEVDTSKTRKIRRVMAERGAGTYYYVGDTKGDMLEGREAGARTVAVGWGWHPLGLLAEASPDFIAHTPRDLLCLL